MSRYLVKTALGEFDAAAWISQAQAARIRGVSRQAVAELVKRGRLTTLTVGERKFLKRSEVENFESRAPGPAPKRKKKG